jgi:Sap, sulfolipid-1-addressing protein
MSQDLLDIFLLSLLAMFNPTLLAAVTLMLFLPSPRPVMLGYLLGAYTMSITLGLVIVFSLSGSSAVSTARNTISPGEDLVVGLLLLLVAFVLHTDRDEGLRRRRQKRKDAKRKPGEEKEAWPQRLLGRGSARVAFAVGVLLTFPGVSYLAALDHIANLDPGTGWTVLLVLYFCVFQLLLLELPLLGYVISPERTQSTVVRLRAALGAHSRRSAIYGAAALGAILILRGLLTLG